MGKWINLGVFRGQIFFITTQKNFSNWRKKFLQLGKFFVTVSKILTTNVKISQYNSKSYQKRRKKGVVDPTRARGKRGENGTFCSGHFEK